VTGDLVVDALLEALGVTKQPHAARIPERPRAQRHDARVHPSTRCSRQRKRLAPQRACPPRTRALPPRNRPHLASHPSAVPR
jgi:hypothetical protein